MAEYKLYHGNMNYSSWSMRGWLALAMSGAEFDCVAFHLGDPDVRRQLAPYSPTLRVPVLHHGDLVISDSLAIAEYIAEQFPDAGLWPEGRVSRALARAVVAEMHSGFPDLRKRMPFNLRRSSPGKGRGAGVAGDIARIREVWRACRGADAASGGPFLFGDWCLADVFYAPVVSRFRTYEVELDPVCRAYADAVWSHPDVVAWSEGALAETWVESEFDL